jgi:hypothetical protein
MSVDPEAVERAQALLEESDRVDAREITLVVKGDEVILSGAVSTPEEATVAAMLVEQEVGAVVDDLRVETSLREGLSDPVDAERAVPAENEVLVGDPDMLAGPESEITGDMTRALEENEPLDPPDSPHLAGTLAEQRGAGPLVESSGGLADLDIDAEADAVEADEDAQPAAADLSAEELRLGAEGHPVPALDPGRTAQPVEAQPDPSGREPLGGAPSEDAEADRFPDQVPGTQPGPGAVGESTTGGGPLGGTPATETGGIETDTASADPTRGASGGTMSDLGSEPGPPAADDPPLREDVPRHD